MDDVRSDPAFNAPRSDPSELTTRALLREIGSLKELIDTRLSGMDKAIKLAQDAADRQPTAQSVAQSVNALKELINEKFERIDTQLRERDAQAILSAKTGNEAIGKALAAAKEAVSEQNSSNALAITKSEISTQKQIDQIGASIATLAQSMNDKINDIKDRMSANDLLIRGNISNVAGRHEGIGSVAAVVLGAVAVVSAMAATASVFITFSKL